MSMCARAAAGGVHFVLPFSWLAAPRPGFDLAVLRCLLHETPISLHPAPSFFSLVAKAAFAPAADAGVSTSCTLLSCSPITAVRQSVWEAAISLFSYPLHLSLPRGVLGRIWLLWSESLGHLALCCPVWVVIISVWALSTFSAADCCHLVTAPSPPVASELEPNRPTQSFCVSWHLYPDRNASVFIHACSCFYSVFFFSPGYVLQTLSSKSEAIGLERIDLQ